MRRVEFYDASAAATRREDVACSLAPCILCGLAVFRGTLLASECLIDEMGFRLVWAGVRRLLRGKTAAPVGTTAGQVRNVWFW